MKFLLFLFAVVGVVAAIPRKFQGKFVDNTGVLENSRKDVNYQFVSQFVDHFNREDGRTFQQRYYVNTTYWNANNSNSPVFLCVGGEGPPLDDSVLVDSVHCTDMVELAAKQGALMFALEHRYYGLSQPFGQDFSTPNLQWLNSEQALMDLAQFVSGMNAAYKLQSSNKWVTWGGSYPGMMAGLARYRFPHLIHAAVASSAPLQAAVEMPGYNDVVASSMAAEIVGGSAACSQAIADGHQYIGEQLQTAEGQANIEKLFNVCTPGALADKQNQATFAGDGVVYLPVQSNDPACQTSYCNIEKICKLMTDTSVGSPVERLASLSKAQNYNKCVSISSSAMTDFYTAPHNPDRVWLFQTCTEWGFYMTCTTGSKCPYTQGLHTVDQDLDLCTAAFNVSAAQVQAQIAQTQANYGGVNIQASRILYTNGEIDPWHANSVLVSPSPVQQQQPTLWVKGASHHFWTHPSLPTDSVDIRMAREVIWNTVTSWLAEA